MEIMGGSMKKKFYCRYAVKPELPTRYYRVCYHNGANSRSVGNFYNESDALQYIAIIGNESFYRISEHRGTSKIIFNAEKMFEALKKAREEA
jgi:hypothetical protein